MAYFIILFKWIYFFYTHIDAFQHIGSFLQTDVATQVGVYVWNHNHIAKGEPQNCKPAAKGSSIEAEVCEAAFSDTLS